MGLSLKFSPHHDRSFTLPSRSRSPALCLVLLSVVLLCVCPRINPSIYSRSLPTLSLSVLLEKRAVGAAE